jgi:mono/diheme cytochrome c family protein
LAEDGSTHDRSIAFALALASLLVTLLVSQILLAEGLAPPAGYKPDKKTKRLFEAKCATCHGDDGRAKTELGEEMGIADMTKAAYWKDLTPKARASPSWKGSSERSRARSRK